MHTRPTWTIGGAAVLAVSCLAGLPSGSLTAAEPMSLPAFELAALDGEAVASARLAGPGTWLLVSVRPASSPSRVLLKTLGSPDLVPASGRIAIVVDGTADEARQMRDANPDLAASWYADPRHEVFERFRLQGTPTVLGFRANSLAWTLQGALGAKQLSTLRSWLGL